MVRKNNWIGKLNQMGRRRFLDTLSSLGVSATTLQYISQDDINDLTSDPKNEVPYVEQFKHTNPKEVRKGNPPKREPIYQTISRDRWIEVESAHNAAKKLREKLERDENIKSNLIQVGVTTVNDGHQKKKAVEVSYVNYERNIEQEEEKELHTPDISKKDLSDKVPGQLTGTARDEENENWTISEIPTVIKESNQKEAAGCERYYYDGSYDRIPGGSVYEVGGGSCTFGTPAYNVDSSERQMVTAGHCLDGHTYEDIYQPDNDGESDGTVYKYRDIGNDPFGVDYGLIRPPDSTDGSDQYRYLLADDNGEYKDNLYIEGSLSWSTIKYQEGKDYEIKQQGGRTGTTTGKIKSAYENDGNWYFRTTADAYSGDSGGPFYHVNDDNSVVIAGIFARYESSDTCPGDESWGTAMEKIEDSYNLVV